MPLNWKPDAWAKLAQEEPETFLEQLKQLGSPRSSLFTKTYLECVAQGFRALNKHQNTKYEETFFLEMAKRLPHENAHHPEIHAFEWGTVQSLQTDRTPIEFLLWHTAVAKHTYSKQTVNVHNWLLQLKKPNYDPAQLHASFSLNNAPEWAAAYTIVQRGGSSRRLLQWLADVPIQESLQFFAAAGSLHAKEKPQWLVQCLETVLSHTQILHNDVRAYDILPALYHAWALATLRLDALVEHYVCGAQPKSVSILDSVWFGTHYNSHEKCQSMLDWWSRQTPSSRGHILHRWWTGMIRWENWTDEDVGNKKPGIALDIFTSYPVEMPHALARDLIQCAPIQNDKVRRYLARIVPAIHAAELVMEPKDIRAHLLKSWDAVHGDSFVLSIAGLLDFEP